MCWLVLVPWRRVCRPRSGAAFWHRALVAEVRLMLKPEKIPVMLQEKIVPSEETIEAIARALFRAHDDEVSGGIAGWRAVARVAFALGARPRGADPRERLAELMDPT